MLNSTATYLARFGSNESGATAIEYALIATCVFLGIVPLIDLMNNEVSDMYNTIVSFFG